MSTDSNNPQENKNLEVLWTVPQVARYLSVSVHTVYRWIQNKRVLDTSKLVRFSNRVRVPRSEVLRIAGAVKSKLEK